MAKDFRCPNYTKIEHVHVNFSYEFRPDKSKFDQIWLVKLTKLSENLLNQNYGKISSFMKIRLLVSLTHRLHDLKSPTEAHRIL